jgi:carbonic anhydrase
MPRRSSLEGLRRENRQISLDTSVGFFDSALIGGYIETVRNKEIQKLVAGFKRFSEKYFKGDEGGFPRLSDGQSPKTLIIGCSDSRVDPALITLASPGELFVVRNVANLIPPFESTSSGHHGVSAAIEFAVVNLKVENVIILGHRQCGGIRALMSGPQTKEDSFIGMWMEIAESAKDRVIKKFSKLDFETQCKECELEGIITSIENLKTFPFVKEAIKTRKLNILGIYFDLEKGTLLEYDENTEKFNNLT